VKKSSIVQCFVQKVFIENVVMTWSADFQTDSCPVKNEIFKLQICDRNDQKQFHSISKFYFRNVVGVILVYDISKFTAFDQIGDWLNDLHNRCDPNANILLIGNKADLEKKSPDFQ
jgi:small GTP-binding protein